MAIRRARRAADAQCCCQAFVRGAGTSKALTPDAEAPAASANGRRSGCTPHLDDSAPQCSIMATHAASLAGSLESADRDEVAKAWMQLDRVSTSSCIWEDLEAIERQVCIPDVPSFSALPSSTTWLCARRVRFTRTTSCHCLPTWHTSSAATPAHGCQKTSTSPPRVCRDTTWCKHTQGERYARHLLQYDVHQFPTTVLLTALFRVRKLVCRTRTESRATAALEVLPEGTYSHGRTRGCFICTAKNAWLAKYEDDAPAAPDDHTAPVPARDGVVSTMRLAAQAIAGGHTCNHAVRVVSTMTLAK